MDPITAIGLSSAVIQITQFGSQMLTKSVEVYISSVGTTARDMDMTFVVEKFKGLNETLKQSIKASTVGSGSASVAQTLTDVSMASERKVIDIAEECTTLADTLLDMLKLVQVRDGLRVWRSIRTALKSLWNKDEIDRMKAKLDDLQRQLQLGFLVDFRIEVKAIGLLQSTSFNKLEVNMQRLIRALATSSDTFVQAVRSEVLHLDVALLDTQNLIRAEGQETRRYFDLTLRQSLPPIETQLTQSSAKKSRADWLIGLYDSLYFDMIEARRDSIPQKHKETYEWIFDESSELHDSRTNFVKWLRSDGAIYWISGKAGSGKSTLMNFISGDKRLQKALSGWAQHTQVLCASFFFWRSGADLQKTLDGLLRSILFQILGDCGEMLEEILGPLYHPRVKVEQFHWSTRKLMECFQRLLSQTGRKVFLLIDGVDEFDGEHTEFVELLQQYSAGGNAKVCISSRPWRIFQTLLDKFPGMRMHELTKKDMIQFVQDNLGILDLGRHKSKNERTKYQNIAITIIDRADGVFIWVTTVVKSVKRGTLAKDSHETLLARIEALPTEILDLYVPMLKGVEPVHVDRQSRLLELMRSFYAEMGGRGGEFRITTAIVYYMEQFVDSQDFAETVSDGLMLETKDQVKAHIEACSMGLIEVDRLQHLVFAHDTVREFLNSPEVRKDLQERCSILKFNPVRTLLKSIISLLNAGPVICFTGEGYSPPWLRLSDGNASGLKTHWGNDGNTIESAYNMAYELARLLEISERVADPVLVDALNASITHCYHVFLQETLRWGGSGLLDKATFEAWSNRHWSSNKVWANGVGWDHTGERYRDQISNPSGLHYLPPCTSLRVALLKGLLYYVDFCLSQGPEMCLQRFQEERSLGMYYALPLPFYHFINAKNLSSFRTAKSVFFAYVFAKDPSALLLHYIRGGVRTWTKLEPEMISMLLSHGANPNARYGAQSSWACFLGRIWSAWDLSPNFLARKGCHVENWHNICQILIQRDADLSLDLWITILPFNSPRGTILARLPAAYILRWFTMVFPIGRRDYYLSNLLLAPRTGSCSNFTQNESGRFVVNARIVRDGNFSKTSHYYSNVVIHDESYQLPEVDAFMTGNTSKSETLETMIDLSNGIPRTWASLEFCGDNAEQAKRSVRQLYKEIS